MDNEEVEATINLISPEELYRKSKLEREIYNNMDLTLAITELEKIIEWHLLGIEFKTPKTTDIKEPTHIIYQELLRKWREIYRTHFEQNTQTEDELDRRHKDFTKNIEPFVAQFSKLIYSLIK